jgi:hypothetical protein
LSEGWERDGARLFLSPALYYEVLLIQYLVSRSHAHGGYTMEGRLTLMDLLRRLRHGGYLEALGITGQDSGEVFEKLVAHLASEPPKPSTAKPPAKTAAKKKTAKGAVTKAGKAAKGKHGAAKVSATPEDEPTSEPVKLHFIVDRRDFLQKVKTVYAHSKG